MDEFFTKANLKERGWTDGLVSRFLPAPDKTKPNPQFRSAAPMRLYAQDRVERVEATEDFKAAQAKANGRKRSAEKAVESKKVATMAYVETRVKIHIPKMSRERLVDRASRHYNDRNQLNGDAASKDSDQLFLDRICVNYLRHETSGYDAHLEEIAGRVGTHDAYAAIRKLVLARISSAYPWLASECMRQEFKD